MNISGITQANTASSVGIKVAEQAEDQKEEVVGKILEGIEQTPAPSADGKGTLVNKFV